MRRDRFMDGAMCGASLNCGRNNDELSTEMSQLPLLGQDRYRMSGQKDGRNAGEVVRGTYHCGHPLVRPSRLTTVDRGGIGKDLSEGWCANFAVGCTHGCPFCYVDAIHKRFGVCRHGDVVLRRWGSYILVPANMDEAISCTPWGRWRGKEVMMSSTHDPYLPELVGCTRKILEASLPAGVRYCIQTRSPLVLRDMDLFTQHADQVRIQVSIATMSRSFASVIEPGAAPPEARVRILREAKAAGLRTGVIVAPVFPPTSARRDVSSDLRDIADALAGVKPDHVYGECLHLRGQNYRLVEEAIGESLPEQNGWDSSSSESFSEAFRKYDMKAMWWSERTRPPRLRVGAAAPRVPFRSDCRSFSPRGAVPNVETH